MTAEMMLDYIGIATDATAVKDDNITFNLNLTDTNEKFYIKRKAGALLVYPGENKSDAMATITCKKKQLLAMMMGKGADIASTLDVTGDTTVPARFYSNIKMWTMDFNIVEP